jgi:hypothetical protein
MHRVGVEGGAVGELHYAAECVALRARRKVGPDVGFEETGDLSLQGADFGLGAEFLFFGDVGFPAESEGVDYHDGYYGKSEGGGAAVGSDGWLDFQQRSGSAAKPVIVALKLQIVN